MFPRCEQQSLRLLCADTVSHPIPVSIIRPVIKLNPVALVALSKHRVKIAHHEAPFLRLFNKVTPHYAVVLSG